MKLFSSNHGATRVPTDAIRQLIQAVAFWSAVALPFLYLPLLLHGLETPRELAAFFGLLALNIVAFVLGHGYKR